MKTTLLAAFAVTLLFGTQLQAQTSCPIINNGSFRIATNPVNSCERTATFTFVNPTNGSKRINVVVLVGATQVINDCVDASNQANVVRTYTSAPFTACNMSDIKVQVTPFTGGTCGTSGCAPTLMSIAGAALPVVFTEFNATRSKETVTLKWVTSTEINNTGFNVERNMNGTWESIGFISTQAFAGNSSSDLTYQFTDINYSKGMTQYRLKQVDIDGAAKYSDVRAVRGTMQDAKTTIYPNPSVDGKVNVVFNEAATRDIIVTDMAGRNIKQWTGYKGNSLQVAGLPTGMFTLLVMNRESGERSTEKIMITGK